MKKKYNEWATSLLALHNYLKINHNQSYTLTELSFEVFPEKEIDPNHRSLKGLIQSLTILGAPIEQNTNENVLRV